MYRRRLVRSNLIKDAFSLSLDHFLNFWSISITVYVWTGRTPSFSPTRSGGKSPLIVSMDFQKIPKEPAFRTSLDYDLFTCLFASIVGWSCYSVDQPNPEIELCQRLDDPATIWSFESLIDDLRTTSRISVISNEKAQVSINWISELIRRILFTLFSCQ